MSGVAWRGPALTLLMLLACWPAWSLGGWIATSVGLVVLDLPIRVAAVLLMLNIAGEALDRLAAPAADGADHD